MPTAFYATIKPAGVPAFPDLVVVTPLGSTPPPVPGHDLPLFPSHPIVVPPGGAWPSPPQPPLGIWGPSDPRPTNPIAGWNPGTGTFPPYVPPQPPLGIWGPNDPRPTNPIAGWDPGTGTFPPGTQPPQPPLGIWVGWPGYPNYPSHPIMLPGMPGWPAGPPAVVPPPDAGTPTDEVQIIYKYSVSAGLTGPYVVAPAPTPEAPAAPPA